MNRQPFPQERVKELADKADGPHEFVLSLHRQLFPEWDRIDELDDYVKAPAELCRYAIELGLKRWPEVGGLIMMNWGFSQDDTVPAWTVEVPTYTLKPQEATS